MALYYVFSTLAVCFIGTSLPQTSSELSEDKILALPDGGDGRAQIPFCETDKLTRREKKMLVEKARKLIQSNAKRHYHPIRVNHPHHHHHIHAKHNGGRRRKRGTVGHNDKIWNKIPIIGRDGKRYFMIPFTILSTYETDQVEVLLKAMKAIEKNTCIRFDRIDSQKKQNYYKNDDYIAIVNQKGCHSVIGRHSGKNLIRMMHNSSLTCLFRKTVIHEFFHMLGLHHEHQRPDRDTFLEVMLDNVDPKMLVDYNKERAQNDETWGFPYDYESVMNYRNNLFTKDPKKKKKTIVVRNGTRKCQIRLGTHDHVSEMDLLLINMLYNCEGVDKWVEEFIERHFPEKHDPVYERELKLKKGLARVEHELKKAEKHMEHIVAAKSGDQNKRGAQPTKSKEVKLNKGLAKVDRELKKAERRVEKIMAGGRIAAKTTEVGNSGLNKGLAHVEHELRRAEKAVSKIVESAAKQDTAKWETRLGGKKTRDEMKKVEHTLKRAEKHVLKIVSKGGTVRGTTKGVAGIVRKKVASQAMPK